MTDIELLKKHIEKSGVTMVALAEKAGMQRVTLYNRLSGIGQFTVDEMIGLSSALRLREDERDAIFFNKKAASDTTAEV